jgi:hypothetical protein
MWPAWLCVRKLLVTNSRHKQRLLSWLFRLVLLSAAGGRYLNDTWALNLENLAWRSLPAPGKAPPPSSAPEGGAPPPPPPLPAIAGHVAVPWQGNVVIVGGHMKVGSRGWEALSATAGERCIEPCCCWTWLSHLRVLSRAWLSAAALKS